MYFVFRCNAVIFGRLSDVSGENVPSIWPSRRPLLLLFLIVALFTFSVSSSLPQGERGPVEPGRWSETLRFMLGLGIFPPENHLLIFGGSNIAVSCGTSTGAENSWNGIHHMYLKRKKKPLCTACDLHHALLMVNTSLQVLALSCSGAGGCPPRRLFPALKSNSFPFRKACAVYSTQKFYYCLLRTTCTVNSYRNIHKNIADCRIFLCNPRPLRISFILRLYFMGVYALYTYVYML